MLKTHTKKQFDFFIIRTFFIIVHNLKVCKDVGITRINIFWGQLGSDGSFANLIYLAIDAKLKKISITKNEETI